MKEARLLYRYKGHVDRFIGTTSDYDITNPLEVGAGIVHLGASFAGGDALVRQGLSTLDGSAKEGVSAYHGPFGFYGRTTENTIGTVGNVLRGKFGAALGGVINIAGDGLADTADLIAGVRHGEQYHQAA